jgi:cysteinyl-tRNA synthetase
MNDDFNTAITIASLFEAVRIINSVNAGTETISESDLVTLKKVYHDFVFDILGLKTETASSNDDVKSLMDLILSLRADAKGKKDFPTSDKIREELTKAGFEIKDGKDGASWNKS